MSDGYRVDVARRAVKAIAALPRPEQRRVLIQVVRGGHRRGVYR